MTAAATPAAPRAGYADLDPARVLGVLDMLGLRGDGRLLQLNSYENRVFQVFLEDGDVVVAKFYRPERWSDAQILEEHAFARELADDDVPAVAPRTLSASDDCQAITLLGDPPTLARCSAGDAMHRVAVCDRHAGRSPELEDPTVLQWLGRFLGRLHAVGARRPFNHRRTIDAAGWGHDAMKRLLDGDFIPDTERAPWSRWCEAALGRVDGAFAQVAIRGEVAPARGLPPRQHHVARRGAACGRPRRCLQRPGRAGPVDAAVGRRRIDARTAGASVVWLPRLQAIRSSANWR